ncbi:MAG: hypothetical protein ACOX3C_02570 [Bacilli bacterium]|jgi:hypothetical protein
MKSKKILVGIVTLLLFSSLTDIKPTANAVKAEEIVYAPYVKGEDWGSPWGLFGTTEEDDGLNVVYDGWYLTALNPEYISVNLSLKTFMESVAGESGWVQESIVQFAFLTETGVAPDWGRSKKGLYMMIRNIDGNLYLDANIFGNSSTEIQKVFEGTLALNVFDLSSITLKTVGGKISLSVNDIAIGSELLSTLAMSEITDNDGFNYFALQTYAAGGEGEDADKRLIKLKYFATYEGQIPKPAEIIYAPYVQGENWGSPWGLFGTTEERDGLNIIYDGWYLTALDPEYISVNLSIKTLMKSIANESGWVQESLFQFAFLTETGVAPDWGRSKKGLYMMVRNIDGNLHLDVKLNANSSSEVQDVYEGTLSITVADLSSITLKKVDDKISLAFNDILIGSDLLSTVAMSEITDTNGLNYFALQSYSAGGAGEDADKRLVKLSYFATFEGQIPDPSITADPEPIEGEEDYNAPTGLGLTATKYNENVVQKDDCVAIKNSALLYTALSTDCIEISGKIAELVPGNYINIQLNKKQALTEATVLVRFIFDDVLKFSFDDVTYVVCGNALPTEFHLKIVLVEDVYHIICNNQELTTTVAKDDITGQYGTFLSYEFNGEGLLEVYSMGNPQLFLDATEKTAWDSPFDGVTEIDGETVIFAHSTLKAPLDYKYVAFDFTINGLLDTNITTAHLGFALLKKCEMFDPIVPTQNGIHVLLRNRGGNLEVKVSLRNELMGVIDVIGWTALGIGVSERITLRFVNDAERDTYRIIINDKEISHEKMFEVLGTDACNRNGQSFLATSCWHNNEVVNEDIYAERSFIVHGVDNKLDEGDIPATLTEIGGPDGGGNGDTSGDTTSDVVITSEEDPGTTEEPKKKPWVGIGITGGVIVVTAAIVGLVFFIRKRKII